MGNNKPLLEMKKIVKRFPGVLALDNVDLVLYQGEVLSLLGENGAGKSTLLKILSGAYTMDSGEIFLDGKLQDYKKPLDALNSGISVIYQELNYLDELSVAENIFVGRLFRTKSGLVDWNKLYGESQKILQRFECSINPKTPMNELSVAEKQLVEIAKSISKDVRILVMDEPTSALNNMEVEALFATVRQLKESGVAVIFISHRMDELFAISDRIQVLRDGSSIGVFDAASVSRDELVHAMVGRKIEQMYPKIDVDLGETILKVENLSNKHIHDISFDVKAGEIVGFFGLLGSGRTKLCEALFGLDKINQGSITIDNKKVSINRPIAAKKVGFAYVPSDRKTQGLLLNLSVKENLATAVYEKLKKRVFLDAQKEKANAEEWVSKLSISTPGLGNEVQLLSGGNQQKVVIGKWLATKPKIILMNDPTRGIDVGAKVEVYSIMEELCRQGIGIILISSEQAEIMALSDRIIVMCDGKITGELSRQDFDFAKIMRYATGGR